MEKIETEADYHYRRDFIHGYKEGSKEAMRIIIEQAQKSIGPVVIQMSKDSAREEKHNNKLEPDEIKVLKIMQQQYEDQSSFTQAEVLKRAIEKLS